MTKLIIWPVNPTEQLEITLRAFLSYLETHTLLWPELMKKTERPVIALGNQCEQLQLVLRAKDEECELFKFPNLKNRLVTKIKAGLEAEVSSLMKSLEEFSAANQKLADKLTPVQNHCRGITITPAILQASATQPSIMQMLEYADDSTIYYQDRYLQMSNSLKLLKYEDEKTVCVLSQVFKVEKEMKAHIEYILAITEYFVKSPTPHIIQG